MKTDKERELTGFLDRISEVLGKNDEDGTRKETALLYLEKNNLNFNDINDLFAAMDNSLKESNRLLKIQNELVKQGDQSTDLPWLNEAQIELSRQQQGILELMLQLRNKKYS